MNFKDQACIRSLGGKLAEVEITEKRGDNQYVAIYNGKKYSAIFNPFVGRYYVDDVDGAINQ